MPARDDNANARGPDHLALGLEVCIEDPPAILKDPRFGVLVNQASVDRRFRYAHELLAERFPGQLRALFGPQHGLWSEQQDDMIETPHRRDARLGVPVFSLYADARRPTPEMLDGLDLLVVDLQDVGTRVYTYVWTLTHCMEACAERGVPVLVLDRPNPLGGEVVEGPLLDPAFSSFVGRAPIPMRHGLTIGELTRHLNRAMGIDADLHVVAMRGWHRGMLWPDTGRAWVPTSPNLPRFEGALVYPGQVLLEGTNLSEGRGTTTPFEVLGAPWLDGRALADATSAWATEGVALRPVRFEPTFHKHAGESCGGVFIHPLEPAAVRSYALTFALLAAARAQAPDRFAWKQPPYEYEREKMPIDLLSGSPRLRAALDAAAADAGAVPDARDLRELTYVDVAAWERETAAARLYPGRSD